MLIRRKRLSAWGPSRIEPLEDRTLLSAPPSSFQSRGPGGGGAFFQPSFSPYNAGELYATSDMSGLYHSTNYGADWQIQDFRQIQANRASVVQFTSSPSVLYAVDQSELPLGGSRNVPTKSTDGGATWSPMTATWPGSETYSLNADPASTTRFIASDYSNLYITTNSGTSFALRYTAPNDGAGLHVAGAFFDGTTIYVGTNRGLLRSTDNGATFSIVAVGGIPAGQGMLSFAAAKQGGVVRMFCTAALNSDLYAGVAMEGVAYSVTGLYSLDAGQANWTSRSAGVPAGMHPAIVSLARGDVSTVYVAGASDASAPIVIKSTTGGTNWASVLNTTNNGNVATGWQGASGDRGWSFGELAMAFSVAPNNASVLAFTDFGFLHLSTDGGATWRQAYVKPADQNPAGSATPKHKAYHGVGFEDTSALWMQWTSASRVVAGYTDITGVVSSDDGASWSFPTYNPQQNTIYQVSAATSGMLYAASSTVHDLYQSTYLTDARIDGGSGRVMFSTDQGANWNTLHDFKHPVIYTAVDPTNANRMYASVVHSTQGGIFVTNDLNLGTSSTWTKLANPPRTEGHPYDIKVLNDGTLVASYSARRNSAGTFTSSSGVFVSTDGGQTWADRTGSGMNYWTKDVVIDPTDPTQNRWFAAVRSGFGGTGNGTGGLYKTTNRGVSWTRVFSADSAESLAIAPSSGDVYLGTLSGGLWYGAAAANAASPSFSQLNYPFRQVNRVFINPYNESEVWVAGFGYGLAVGTAGDTTPPAVLAAKLQGQPSASKSIVFTFSEDVSASIGTGDLTLTNLSTNSTIPATSASGDAVAKTATFNFASNIPTGRYHAVLTATGVRDTANNPLTADYTFDFIFVATTQTLALPANSAAFKIQQLLIEPNAKLDVRNTAFVLDYAPADPNPAASVEQLVRTGFHGGDWLGASGITSSTAADPASLGRYAVGVADNAKLVTPFGNGTTSGPLFAGQSVDGTAVLVKFTHRVDLNLDGLITTNDAAVFNSSYSAGAAAKWISGDVDFDGLYGANDAAIFNSFYDESLGAI